MVEITLWGNKYFEISREAKAIVKHAKHDKEGLINSFSAQLKNCELNFARLFCHGIFAGSAVILIYSNLF